MNDQPLRESHKPEGGTGDALSAAWDQFYAHCAAIIRGCPSVRKLSDFDREDCVQEVMIDLVRKFGVQRPDQLRDEMSRWIRTVSRNKATDIIRRRYRRPEVGFADGSGEAVLDDETSLEQARYVALVWEALVSLDQKVPVTSYLIFYLHTIEEWDINEVAEMFQITPGTARTRSHRVKEKFETLIRTIDRDAAPSG
jgi:RNA polymerase sigma factor (sigma-70 family)